MQTPLDNIADASNAVVLDAARAGDATAWNEIVRRYQGVVRAAVASCRLNPTDATDAIQNTWLRLFEHAATIRNPERLGGWLMTTAKRECLAFIRRYRIEHPLATIETDPPGQEPTPEAMAITAETRARVRRAASALPGRSRTLIDALYYRPCGSYAEIARHTGIPVGSIGPTRLRTMRCLRRGLLDLQ
jgi:RNA polymerase sigma factor (sigma-70 family)